MAAPLAGLKVIDLTQGDGAPFCAMMLGDAGADVVKVEPLAGDWARPLGGPFDHGDGPLFMGMNRNKRSIALDIEQGAGREVVLALAKGADILVESFPKAGDAARLGLDYETLNALNPRLIYCDISPLERKGPWADKPATDLTVQGIAGITRFVGERGKEPLRFGSNYAGAAASWYAMQAILASVFWRRKSGLGQKIETSYLRALIATQQNYITGYSDPDIPGAAGFYTSHIAPPGRGWATKDGRIEFTVNRGRGGASILDMIGVPEDLKARLGSSLAGFGSDDSALKPYFEKFLAEKTTDEALQILDELGYMCSPIHNYDSMFHDEGVLQQQMLVEVEHPVRGAVKTTGLVWKMSDTPASIRLAPPLLGEHTDVILSELGYDAKRIEGLRASGVVG